MKQSDFTDEEILSNMKEILQNPMLRKCEQCANADEECTFCSQLKKPIARWMYSGHCKFYETHEERIIRKTRENDERKERINKRANTNLNIALTATDVGIFFLEAFERIVEREYRTAEALEVGDSRIRKTDRATIAQLKRAFKEMHKSIENASKQFNHFVMPLYNKVFYDKETKQYDAEQYDCHLMDLYELAEVVMRYYDIAFENHEQGLKIREHLKTYPTGGVLAEEDYIKLNFKR